MSFKVVEVEFQSNPDAIQKAIEAWTKYWWNFVTLDTRTILESKNNYSDVAYLKSYAVIVFFRE